MSDKTKTTINVPKPKITKSWTVTLITTMVPIIAVLANAPLASVGVEISEEMIQTVLMPMFGISAAAGIGNATRKQFRKPQPGGGIAFKDDKMYYETTTPNANRDQEAQPYKPARQIPPNIAVKKHDTTDVNFVSAGNSWLETSVGADRRLLHGQVYLWASVKDAISPIRTRLSDKDGKVYHNGVSSPFDEDNDETTSRIKLFGNNGAPFPRGKYTLHVSATLPDAQAEWDMEFDIV